VIIDCFPFFDELDLLEVRLHELSDVVDMFVLSEATRTFTGKPKPLYFDANKKRFMEFSDKIEHVVIDTYNASDLHDPWNMDYYQKQQGLDAAIERFCLGSNDIIILSDCDEILKADSVKKAIKVMGKTVTMKMPLFNYWMNCICTSIKWVYAKLARCEKNLSHRRIRYRKSACTITDAGWHFSFLGDVKRKLEAYAHTEYNRAPFNTAEHIENQKKLGRDLFNRKNYRHKFLDDINYLPEYVLSNMDKFGKYIKK
jgi:beta-1,4-mannosyl-glycoprotein beta-1,4-N-acetylglucosaminyltransferase